MKPYLIITALLVSNFSYADFSGTCSEEDIQEYLTAHYCMIESEDNDCFKMSFQPKGAMGFIGGFGESWMKQKAPDMLEKLKIMNELNEEAPKLRDAYKKFQAEAFAETNKKQIKIIDKLIDDFKDNKIIVEELKRNRGLRSFHELSIRLNGTVGGEKINKALKPYYAEVNNLVLNKIAKGGFKISSYFSFSQMKDILHFGVPSDFMKSYTVTTMLFPKEHSELVSLKGKAHKQAREELYKKDPNAKKVLEDPSQRDANNQTTEYKKLTDKAYARRMEIQQGMLEKASPRMRLYNVIDSSIYSFDSTNIEDMNNKAAAIRPRPSLRTSIFAGALVLPGAQIYSNSRSREELKSCKRYFDLSDSEIDFLNNSDVIWAASQVKSDRMVNHCKTMYLTEPEKTINSAIEKFGSVPPGLCRIMKKEKERLTKSLDESLKSAEADCNKNTFKSENLNIVPGEKGSFNSEIKITRPEGTYIYQAPVHNGTKFADFRYVKVFRLNKDGSKKEDYNLTQDFLKFYNSMRLTDQAVKEMQPPQETLDTEEKKATYKKHREARYNAVMNQFMRGYVDECKDYNTLECEVIERSLNITPVLVNFKKGCEYKDWDKYQPQPTKESWSSKQ